MRDPYSPIYPARPASLGPGQRFAAAGMTPEIGMTPDDYVTRIAAPNTGSPSRAATLWDERLVTEVL